MTGSVCGKHDQWCPDGACRWCEPEPTGLSVIIPRGSAIFGIDDPPGLLMSIAAWNGAPHYFGKGETCLICGLGRTLAVNGCEGTPAQFTAAFDSVFGQKP